MIQNEFSSDDYCVLAFKGKDLFKLSLNTQELLVNKLNESYGKTFKKYNIIVGSRIANVNAFERDSGLGVHPELSYFYAFITKDPLTYSPLKQSTYTKREIFENYEVFYVTERENSILHLSENCLKATTAFKPHKASAPNLKIVEPTCFVSFMPKLGVFFLPFTERLYKTKFDVEKYIVEVVKEHDLVDYYLKKHSYKLIGEILVPKDFDHVSTGIPLEFKLNDSFHISIMEKVVS